jgi:hypothetical protein
MRVTTAAARRQALTMAPGARAIVVAVVSAVAGAAAGWVGNAMTTTLVLVGRIEALEKGQERVEARLARMEAMMTAAAQEQIDQRRRQSSRPKEAGPLMGI